MSRTLLFFLVLLTFPFSNYASFEEVKPIKVGKVVKKVIKSPKRAVSIAKRCNNANVELFTADTGPYQWQKDGADIVGATSNTYSPTTAGKYVLVIGSETSNEIELNFLNPTASFTQNSSGNACGSETVSFTNTSNNGETYYWEFGDGATSREENPTHEFKATPGSGNQSFTVKLTVTSAECKSVVSATQNVSVKQMPDAKLGGTGSYTYDGKPYFRVCSNNSSTFNFTNQSSTSSINTNYKIDWGDGSPVFEGTTFNATSHTYNKGIYSLTYTVTGNNGCIATVIYTIFVGGNPAVGLGNPGNTSICTGQTLEFPITLTENNPVGTTYTIRFNDGSDPIVLQHPLPSNYKIVHTFTKSSCGTTSYNGTTPYPNAFAVFIEASNPCDKSGASVVPIYVSDKPKASFTIDKGKAICENTSLRFTSTSKGNTASSSGCQIGKLIWVIEPLSGSSSAGYSTASNLGNDYGFLTDPGSWLNGANSVDILFKTAGRYRVSLKVAADAGTGSCGPDLYSEEICVNPKPVASFTLPAANCVPFVLKPNNTSNSPTSSCGTNTYQWSVTRKAQIDCDRIGILPTYVNGTSATSENPEFNFTIPGIYTIQLITKNSDGSCTSNPYTQDVTIKSTPSITFSTSSYTVCEGGAFTPTVTIKNCYSTGDIDYYWTFPSSNTPTSNLKNPTDIIYPTKGVYAVGLTLVTECGSVSTGVNITVIEKPVLADKNNIIACNGAIVSVGAFANVSGMTGVSYTWTNSNTAIGLASLGTGTISNFTARNTGTTPITSTITVTPTSGSCVGTPKTFTITVNPAVAAANAGANLTECDVTSTRLSATPAPTGGVWSVVTGTGLTFDDATRYDATVSGLVNGGSYVLKWTVKGYAPCGDSEDTINITVAPKTVAGTTSGTATYCGTASTGTVTLTGHVGTVMGWEQSTNGTTWTTILPLNYTPTLNYSNLTSTRYYRAVVKSGNCNQLYSSETKIEVVQKPNPPAVTANYTYCLNDAATQLTATGTDLKWYKGLPLNSTNLLAEAPTPATNIANTITYHVTQTLDGCESNAATITASVNPSITNNAIGAAQAICKNSAPNRLNSIGMLSGGLGVGSYTYQWQSSTDGTNFTNIASATALNYQPASLTDDVWYRRIVTSGTCTSMSNEIKITVQGTLDHIGISANQTVCNGAVPAKLIGEVPTGGSGTFTYTWERSIVSATTGFSAIPNANDADYQPLALTQTTYFKRLVRSGSCNAVSDVVTITVTPIVTLQQLPDVFLCNGSAQSAINFATNIISSNISFTWVNSETNIGLAASGSANLPDFTANNSLKKPLIAKIDYKATYSADGVACDAPVKSFYINVLPTVTVTNNLPNLTFCTGITTVAIPLNSDVDIFAGSSVKYRWTSSVAIGLADGEGAQIPSFTSVNLGNSPITSVITITPLYTYGGKTCDGTPTTYEITVNPTPKVEFSLPNQTICSNTSTAEVILTSTTASVDISWTATPVAGITGLTTSGTDKIPSQTLVNTTNAPITIIYTAKAATTGAANCAGVATRYEVTVNPIPVVNAAATFKTICSNEKVNIALSSNVTGTVYSWTVSTNANITGATNGNGAIIDQLLINNATEPQEVVYTIMPSFENGQVNCEGSTITIKVRVNPSPKVKFSATDLEICSGATVPDVTLSSTTPNAQITWQVAAPAGINGLTALTGTTEIPVQTLINTGNVPLTVTYSAMAKTADANACAGMVTVYKVLVYPVAKVTNAVLSQQVCSGASSTAVVLASNVSQATFSWTATATSTDVTGFLASGTGNIPAQRLINAGSGVQRITYQITTSAFGCDGMPAIYEIDVYPSPIFTSSTQQSDICSGKTFRYTPTSSTIGVTFKWNRAAVVGISNLAANGSGVDAAGSINEALINTTTNAIDVVYEYEMSINGCSTGIKIPIVVTVNPVPTAMFGPFVQRGCAPFNITIKNLNSRTFPNTYTVDFGDGSPIKIFTDQNDIVHTYENETNQPKTFYLKIKTTNECGEVNSIPYEIIVQPQSVFSKLVLQASDKFGCAPFNVDFTTLNQSTGANLFTWDFGDGSPLQQTRTVNERISHLYNVPGDYTVKLTATNGCSTVSSTQQITIYPQVSTSFTIDKLQECVAKEVTFNNTSDAQFTSLWDFGDGTTSTDVNPKHVFTTPGTKTITLRSTRIYPNGGSCTAITTRTIQILAAPVSSFTTNLGSLNCGPFTLQVRANAGNAVNIEWDFGDTGGIGNVTSGLNASYTYIKSGDYLITSKAYNSQGCVSISTQTVRITESPVAAFNSSINQICGTTGKVNFKNETTYNGADFITYRWFVNSSLVFSGKDLEHNFTVPNGASFPYVFKIRLEATNVVGCKTSVEKEVQFNPFPKAIFNLAVVKGCVPFKLVISNQSTATDTYKWFLNGSLVSNDREPQHIILNEFDKTYRLKLVASNRYGCTESEQTIDVATYPYLKAEFVLNQDLSCNGLLNLDVVDKSVGATTYEWDYGDRSPVYAGTNPQHTYGVAGEYNLKLRVSNGFCTDEFVKKIVVSNSPKAAFLSNVRSGCNQLMVNFQNTSINASDYLWDFGDGTFSKEENPSHNYVFANTGYTVKLTVRNRYGCADETTAVSFINVFPPPEAQIVISPNKVIKVPDYSFKFQAVTTDNIISYRWDFGDGTSADRKEILHKYDRYGTYKVKLYITNSANCTNVIEDEVTILDFPGYLFVPNAFEPNNLNNDLKVFKIKGGGIATYSLKIFNKWGQLLWETNKVDDLGVPLEYWDGMQNGRLLPQGAYYWQAEATFINGGVWKGMKYKGKSESKMGVIHLIR